MKILVVGHRPYVGWLCQELLSNKFLEINPIDLIVVGSVHKSKRKKKKSKLKILLEKAQRVRWDKLLLRLLLNKNKSKEEIKQYLVFNDEIPSTDQIKLVDYSNFFLPGFTSNYDLMLVATYGGKIEKEIFEGPKLGTWNIHPSVLPQLKGGYPTLLQSLDCNYYLGSTIHSMTDKIDNGKIIAQRIRNNTHSIANHQLIRFSAIEAASLLLDLQKNGFKLIYTETHDLESSICKKLHEPEWYLGKYAKGTNVKALVNAYSHLFPYIYYFHNYKLVQILSLTEGENIVGFDNKIVFRYLNEPEKADLIFYGKQYFINAYLFGNKLFVRGN